THNVVAFLEKNEESDGFTKIIDFLKASYVSYALTVNPVIYTSCIEQFWATAKVQTIKKLDDSTAGEAVTTASIDDSYAAPTTIGEITLAQTLIQIKAAKPKVVTTAATTTTTTTKPKARGVVVQEPSEFRAL
ncbi:hypothetical protein Tco_0361552, partial [Tanacetum coccineum]